MRRICLFVLYGLAVVAFAGAQQFVASDCGVFEPFENRSSFVLVVDRSGSMSGEPMSRARDAVRSFVAQVRPEDRVALISFADDVTVDAPLAPVSSRLDAPIDRLRADGGTRLYDAIAAGVRLLERESGVRVIVYLTDGADNRSTLSVRNIRQMNVGEDTIVYGMGLGDVDGDALRTLSVASNGAYEVVGSAGALRNVYGTIRDRYYDRFDAELANAGALTVTSLPAGQPVAVNGEVVGRTPYRLDGVPPGEYTIDVGFERGVWRCTTVARANTRTLVGARERDVPLRVVVETAPTRAAVFLNGDYVGLSSPVPSREVDGTRDVSGQLTIDSVPPGNHVIRVVAAPELDFSPNQVLEFPVEVTDRNVYVKALIFMRQIEDFAGNVRRVAPAAGGTPGMPGNPFGDREDDPFGDIRSRVPGGQ